MALNTLTLAVVQGVQGRRFRSKINGLTAGTEVTVDVDATPGFGVVNGRLSHHSLPYTVNTVAIRERVAATGETKVTRIEINAASAAELAAPAASQITSGRTLRSYRVAATDDGAGSLIWAVYVEDDLGATAVTPAQSVLAALLAYWSANSASATGGLIDSVTGAKGRTLVKTADANRPSLTAGRMIFNAAASTRLMENPSPLQPRKLVATTTVTPPDASGGEAGKGFTCTGMVRDLDGTWWVMNFGVPTEGSGATPAPSIVHLSSDMTTKLGEILFSTFPGGGPSTGTQGLALDVARGELYFHADSKFWFVNKAGTFLRNVTMTGLAINGLVDDPDTDTAIACATGNNTTLRRISKSTGAIDPVWSKPIYGTAIDHLCLANGYLWYSAGDNGAAQGGAIRQLDMATGIVVGEWFIDAGAPEGLWVNGSEVWIANDGYYHNPPGDLTNTIRRYVLDPVPGTYPGAGRRAVAAWVGYLVTPTASTTMAWAVGEPTSSGQRGIGVAFPASVTNTMRVYANNSFATFTTTTNVEAVWSVIWDYDAATARLRKNGVDVATTAITGLSTVAIYPTSQTMLGATREDTSLTRSSNSSQANLILAANPDFVKVLEGVVAWDAGAQALLPSDHDYRNSRPLY